MRDAAKHFKGRVDRYAIWNEPNWHTQLSPTKPCRKNHWVKGCDAALGRLYRALYVAGTARSRPSTRRRRCCSASSRRRPAGRPRSRTAYASSPLAILREITCSKRSWKAASAARAWSPTASPSTPTPSPRAPDHVVGRADDVTLATLDRLTAALDKLAARGALRTPSGAPMELYLSEHGYLQSGDAHAARDHPRRLPQRRASTARWRTRACASSCSTCWSAPPPRQNLFPTQIINHDGTPTESFGALADWSARNAPSLAGVSVHRF